MASELIAADWAPNATTDKRLLDVHAYWQTLSRDGKLPYRADFNPAAIKALLPLVFLVDVLNDPRDFRFRLVGSHIREASKQEMTGHTIAEVFPPQFAAEVHEHWNSVVEMRKPKWGQGRLWLKEREFMKWQGVLMPLQWEDGTIGQLLGGGAFHT